MADTETVAQRLARIRALVEEATPGPWRSDGDIARPLDGSQPYTVAVRRRTERGFFPVAHCDLHEGQTVGTERPLQDAALIAAAPTELRWLLNLVEALQRDIKEMAALWSERKETS